MTSNSWISIQFWIVDLNLNSKSFEFWPQLCRKKIWFFFNFRSQVQFSTTFMKSHKNYSYEFCKRKYLIFCAQILSKFQQSKTAILNFAAYFRNLFFLIFFTVVKFLSFCANIKYQKLYVNIEFWFLNYTLIMVKIWIFPSQITIFFCSVKLKIAKLAKCSGLSVGIRCSRVHEWVRPKDFSARRDFAVRCWASSWVVGKV